MALNIKDPEAERLVAEAAELAGESKTGVIRHALREFIERRVRVEDIDAREARLQRFLEEEIWPLIRAEDLGKPFTKEEQEEILGIGPDGV
jgi:antitoxin VapB